MRETCSSGSVRGAVSNERPYRERISAVFGRRRDGLLTEPIADARVCRCELVKKPKRPSRHDRRTAQVGGELPFAIGLRCDAPV